MLIENTLASIAAHAAGHLFVGALVLLSGAVTSDSRARDCNSAPALGAALDGANRVFDGADGVFDGADMILDTGLTLSKDWIAKTTDNICGLRDTNQVSNPVQIDFKACLDATAEMKKVARDKIDLTTPEGIRLQTDAQNRVTTACETLRVANGYCSVWKTIKHKDGRAVTDITEQVKALL